MKCELEDFAVWGLSESKGGFVTQEMVQRRDGRWFVSLHELPRGVIFGKGLVTLELQSDLAALRVAPASDECCLLPGCRDAASGCPASEDDRRSRR